MPTVGQGYGLNITVKIFNYGITAEILNLTIYVNMTVVFTITDTALPFRNSTTLTTEWNITGLDYGNCTITACCDPVPGENNTADNTCCSWIIITIPGDLNGDYTVDIYDAIRLAGALNSGSGVLNWNPNADINNDYIVDIYDAILLANHYNQHYP